MNKKTPPVKITLLPAWIIHLFLWIGLAAAISIRLLSILNRVNPEWATWVWRFAMVSYTVFFGYRYWITKRRRNVIVHGELVAAVEACEALPEPTRNALLYILRSIMRSKELFNYVFICTLSIIALLIDLWPH